MAAEDALAEALHRLEHKVDLLLELVVRIAGPGNGSFMLTAVGDPHHVCPVCTQSVNYLVDVIKKVVTRKCGCGTGKLAPIDIDQFAPPLLPKRESSHGEPGEDRNDTDRGRRGRPPERRR